MRASKYSPEFENAPASRPESDRPTSAVAHDLGLCPDSLRKWLLQEEADNGARGDRLTTPERKNWPRYAVRSVTCGVQ